MPGEFTRVEDGRFGVEKHVGHVEEDETEGDGQTDAWKRGESDSEQ